MEKHVANYFKAFGYDKSSFIKCEWCGAPANQIHHVEPRSKFGSKRKDEQDSVTNLVALCFECHEKAHGVDSLEIRQMFKNIIVSRLQNQD